MEPEEMDNPTPSPTLDYRDGREDFSHKPFRDFVRGLLWSLLGVGFFVGFGNMEANLDRHLRALRSASASTSPPPKEWNIVLFWFLAATLAGFVAYYLIQRRAARMFWPGFVCGLCVLCLLSGLCFATQ